MKKVILALTGTLLFLSCSDEDFDINRDPDNLVPEAIALQSELPAGIAGIAGAQGAYYALIGGFWAQYWTQSPTANQYKEIDDYSIGTADYTGGWTAMYDALGDVRNVKRLAENQQNWNYYLIATTLEVYASQIMTDFYGDIPYTEANNIDILQPRFQTGQEVYDLMVADLKEALAHDLSTSQGTTPGSDDFIFNGDMQNWRQFANSLLLRLYLRQTEARPQVAQAGIMELFNSGAEFLDEDAAMTQFVDEPNRSNPLYETDRRQLNVATNLRASTTMFSYLDVNNDPRVEMFYNAGNPLNQGDFNSLTPPASIAVVNLEPTTAVYFMSREESLFLQAEALERYMGGAGAREKYEAGVIESFSKYFEDVNSTPVGAAFVAEGGEYEYPTEGTFEEKLEAIIEQKWISLFPGNGFEAFFEQNRTGYPEISEVPQTSEAYEPGELAYSQNGTTGGQFPRRLEYPNNVTTRNPNTPAIIPVTTPIWWDVN